MPDNLTHDTHAVTKELIAIYTVYIFLTLHTHTYIYVHVTHVTQLLLLGASRWPITSSIPFYTLYNPYRSIIPYMPLPN